MAIDTDTKKLSIMAAGLPWAETLPDPTGDLDEGDLMHFMAVYSGFDYQPPPGPLANANNRLRHIRLGGQFMGM